MSKKVIFLSAYHPFADGVHNDSAAFLAAFSAADADENIIHIEPGDYLIDSKDVIPLKSGMSVYAKDARFLFPKMLGDTPHRIMFYGENVSNFYWEGGTFMGYVYNPLNAVGKWEPNASTKCIFLQRTPEGSSEHIRFEGVEGVDVAGAVINVYGKANAIGEDRYPVYDVDVHACRFRNSGKFMWDYGYLWQRIVFPEHHSEEEIRNAYRYMSEELLSGYVLFSAKGEICVENMPEGIEGEADTVSFFGDVPKPLSRGVCYYIRSLRTEGNLTYITVSETRGGAVLDTFEQTAGKCRLFRNLFTVHHNLYAPKGAGTGKGPLDISVANNVKVSDCRMYASGDSMHIHMSHNVIYSGNQITGSRMGAFFIAQFCKNVTVTGNTVLGTNGSRVMSVEKSTEDITIVGNTFSGGGRGTWINQPYNIIIAENIFTRNTNKCTPSPDIGRLTPSSGKYESYPEIYFTTWEKDAKYGAVIMRSNLITASEHAKAAVAFHDGGENIVFEGNVLMGETRSVYVGKKCEMPQMSGNIGMGELLRELDEEKFDQ